MPLIWDGGRVEAMHNLLFKSEQPKNRLDDLEMTTNDANDLTSVTLQAPSRRWKEEDREEDGKKILYIQTTY
uniref:Uncharacterized protein n=1 Tax=Steinernema glaseri TaxID=37863 RepID=A0A1I8ACA4_9BILA